MKEEEEKRMKMFDGKWLMDDVRWEEDKRVKMKEVL
jgi:hypothetical protein